MNNTKSTGKVPRRAADTGWAPNARKVVCIALSCLIALPFGGTALSSMQASAEPAPESEAASAPADGDASASATIEVATADAARALESAAAAHMPTLEEALGGGLTHSLLSASPSSGAGDAPSTDELTTLEVAQLYASAADDKPGTPAYYAKRWQECVDGFSWKATGLPKWNGADAGTQPTEGAGTVQNPYRIYTPEQFRWALKHQASCTLMNDLDLGGDQGRNWTGISYTSAATIDGGGHTVYNLYSYAGQYAGLFSWAGAENYGFVLKNLTLSNAQVHVSVKWSAPLVAGFDGGIIDNCAVMDSLAWQDDGSSGNPPLISGVVSFGWISGGDSRWKGSPSKVSNTYARNVDVKGQSCTSGFTEVPYNALIENCAAIDGTVVEPGGHSGGFTSCDYGPVTYRNCFTNNDVYGNTQTGVFVGVTHSGEHTFENCFAAGKIEGTTQIGGFMAASQGASKDVFRNCYATSMVGMSEGGTNMGGFIGFIDDTSSATQFSFENCYAAGEVGTLKSNDKGEALDASGNVVSTVGGFAGSIGRHTGLTFANCFYDKQTTGSKENAIGTTPHTSIAGLTGVLTKSLTQADLGPAFVTKSGTYPQLNGLANGNAADWGGNQELASIAKAYSQASASTVFLFPSMNEGSGFDPNTADYDTVRRIRYAFPLTNDAMVGDGALNTAWWYYDDGGRFPNQSPINTDAKIITLSSETDDDTMNDVNVTSVATGIGWLRTESTYGGVVGSRNLRLVPTTSVAISKDGKAIVGSDDTVYFQEDESKWPAGSIPYEPFTDDGLIKSDHRDGITFIVASAVNLDAYMNDTAVYPSEEEKLAAHNIVALDFNSVPATSEIATDPTTNRKIYLDYTVTLKNSSGADETQVVRLSVAKVIPDAANPDGPGIMSAPYEWDDAKSLQQLFEGQRSATKNELGKYVLSYQWLDQSKTSVQAQGTKYLTVVSPLSLVYRSGYGQNETLFTDPGAYQNEDPAVAERMPADPTRFGHHFTGWAYERENADGGHDAFAAGTPITAVTDSRGNTNSVIGIAATWEPNLHQLVVKDAKDGTQVQDLETAFGTNLRAALSGYEPAGTGDGEFLGWRIEAGFDGREGEYVSASDTMPDNDVTVYPVFGTEVSASLTAHNETQGVIDGTKHNRVGDIITYEIAVNNNQPDLIWKSATITDALETGQDIVEGSIKLIKPDATVIDLGDDVYSEGTNSITYTIPDDVQTDETYVLMFQVKLNTEAPFVGQGTDQVITNAATVAGTDASGGDVNAQTNEVTLPGSAYVDFAPADKWVSKSARNLSDPDATKAQVGDRISYTLELGNQSEDPNSRWNNAWFYDAVPAGLQVDSSTIMLAYPDAESPGGMKTGAFPTALNEATGEISIAAGTLKAGEQATLTFEVVVTADAVGQSIKNTAWAVTDEPEKPNDPPAPPGPGPNPPVPDPDNPDPEPTDPVGPGKETVNLAVTKTAGVSQASPGSIVPYTITVSNMGNVHAKNVVIADALPEGLEYVSSVPAAQVSGGTVTWTCTVPAGMTVTRTVMARVKNDASGSLVNDVVVNSPDLEKPLSPDTKPSIDVVPSPAEPVVSVSKVATADAAVTGGQLTYYITVTNSGAADANGVIVTDPLPPGLVFTSATEGGSYRNGLMMWNVNIPAQSSKQLAVTANVTAKSGELVNTATAVHGGSADVSNYVTTAVSTGQKPADEPQLSLKKTSAVTQATPGSEVPYTITIANTGAGEAKDVVVTDSLPSGMEYVVGSADPAPESVVGNVVTWKVDVPAGATITRTLTAKVASTVEAGTTLENSVEASNPAGGDPIVPSELPSLEVLDPSSEGDQPILGITKKASAETAAFGETLTYTITVLNTGAVEAKGVTVSDVLPAGLSYQSSTGGAASGGSYDAATGAVTWTVDVPANGSAVCTVAAEVTAKAGSLANAAVAELGDVRVESEAASTAVSGGGEGEAKPQLSIKKTTSVTEASAGSVIPYVITVSNTGNAAAEGVVVTDSLPEGLEYVSSEPAGAVSEDGKTITWTVDVAAGAEAKRQLTTKVADGAATGSQLQNGVSVSNPAGGDPIAPSVDPPTVEVVDPTDTANIVVTKVASADKVVSGSQLTYTIGVTNAGTADAAGVRVSDALPAGTSLAAATEGGSLEKGSVVWTIDLAAGATKELKVTLDVSAAAGSLVNAAQAAFDGGTAVSDPVTTQVESSGAGGDPSAVLSVTKSTNVDKAVQGSSVEYAIVVSNTGDADAKGVTVADTLPAGLLYVSSDPAGSLSADRKTVTWTVDVDAGSSVTRTVTALVTGTQGQSIENGVVVTDPNDPTTPIEPPDKPVIDVTDAADVSASLAVDSVQATSGDKVQYTLTVTNSGTVAAKGVTAEEHLPAGVSFVSASDGGTYAPDEQEPDAQEVGFDLFASVASLFGLGEPPADEPSDKPDAGSVSWTLDVPAGATVARTVSAEVTAESGLLIAGADLTHLEKTMSTNNVQTRVLTDGSGSGEAKLSVTKTTSATQAKPGFDVPYTITVRNTGSADAHDVSIVDALPADLIYQSSSPQGTLSDNDKTITWKADVPAGGTVTYTIAAKVADDAAGSVKNDVTVTPDGGDPVSPPAPPEVPVIPPDDPGDASPHLGIAKSIDAGASATQGDTVTYTLTVSNTGTGDAHDVAVTDVVPIGLDAVQAAGGSYDAGSRTASWTIESVPAGTSKTLTLQAEVTAAAGELVNTAQAALGDSIVQSEPVVTAVEAGGGSGHVPAPSLVMTKTTAVKQAAQGSTVPYAITVRNIGDGTARDVAVTDALPEGLEYVSSEPAATLGEDGALRWTADIDAGGSVSFMLYARVTADPGQTVANTAQAELLDGTLVRPASDPSVTVSSGTPTASVHVAKHGIRDKAPAGGRFAYKIVVTNTGAGDAQGVRVTDTLPVGTSFAAASDGGNYDEATGTVAWDVDVPALGRKELTLTVKVEALAGSLKNTAASSYDGTAETTPLVITPITDDPTEADPEVALTKTVKNVTAEQEGRDNPDDQTTWLDGDELGFTITASNTKDGSLWSEVVLTDMLPDGLELVEGSLLYTGPGQNAASADGAYNADAQSIRVDVGDIPGGQSAELSYRTVIRAGEDWSVDATMRNIAQAAGFDPDGANPVIAEGSAAVATPEPAPVKKLSKTAENLTDPAAPIVQVGDRVRYVITLENAEPNPRAQWRGAYVYDEVPAGLDVDRATLKLVDAQGIAHDVADCYDAVSRRLIVSVGTIEGGSRAAVSFEATIPVSAIGEDVSNVGMVGTLLPDPDDPSALPEPGKPDDALLPDPVAPDPDGAEGNPAPTDPAVPNGNGIVAPADPAPSLEKSVKDLTSDGSFANGDEVLYTVTARNEKPGSYWYDVAITDVLPHGVNLDNRSIRLTAPDGVTTDIAPTCYDDTTRTLSVPAGTIEGGQRYVLTYTARLDFSLAQGAVVNHAIASGGSPSDEGPNTFDEANATVERPLVPWDSSALARTGDVAPQAVSLAALVALLAVVLMGGSRAATAALAFRRSRGCRPTRPPHSRR